MYARLVIGDFMMVIHFLACWEQRQHFRELRATWACGKGQDLLGASFEKKELFLRGRHFVTSKHVERGKIKAQFTCLVISEIPHQY